MFKVRELTSGKIFTVYGVRTISVFSGADFLIHINGSWVWKCGFYFEPYEESEGTSIE